MVELSRIIRGRHARDQSRFTRSDGIERLWEISAPLMDYPPPVEPHEPMSWGPSADRLIVPVRRHLPES